MKTVLDRIASNPVIADYLAGNTKLQAWLTAKLVLGADATAVKRLVLALIDADAPGRRSQRVAFENVTACMQAVDNSCGVRQ